MKLRVREHRKAKGWTIDQLADVSGLSRGFISQLENGHRGASGATLMTLAATFGVPIGALIEDQDAGADMTKALDGMLALNTDDRAAILHVIETMLGPKDKQ